MASKRAADAGKREEAVQDNKRARLGPDRDVAGAVHALSVLSVPLTVPSRVVLPGTEVTATIRGSTLRVDTAGKAGRAYRELLWVEEALYMKKPRAPSRLRRLSKTELSNRRATLRKVHWLSTPVEELFAGTGDEHVEEQKEEVYLANNQHTRGRAIVGTESTNK